MRSIKKLCLAVLCLVFSLQLLAQEKALNLRGMVYGKEGVAVPFATVFLEELKRGGTTSEEGYFEITNIPEGHYTLKISAVGYKTYRKQLGFTQTEDKEVNVTLEIAANVLGEVTIVGKTIAQEIKETGFNVNAIETKKFENTNSDVNRVLNQTTGIRIRETGGLGSGFDFYLNGLSGQAVKFFIDGQPMEDYGSVFNLNNFPVNLIERVDIYKGAVPAFLGSDAMGGAVNIITKQSAKTYLDASYSYGSFNTHRAALTAQWRDSKSGFTIKPQFFYNYSDNNYTMHNLKTIKDKQSSPYVGDFQRFLNAYESYLGDVQVGFTKRKWTDRFFIGLGYGKVNQDLFPARGYKNLDGSFSIATPAGDSYYEKNYRYSLQYVKDGLFVKGLSANVSASFNTLDMLTAYTSADEYNWEGSVIYTNQNPVARLFKYNQKMYQWASSLSYTVNEHHEVSSSITWGRVKRESSNKIQVNDEDYNLFDEPQITDKKVVGLAYKNTQFNGKLQTILSAKLYSFLVPSIVDRENKDAHWGYGIATRYKLSDNWLIKASYEKAYRLPEAVEIFGDGKFIRPNLGLLPENSHNINLGTQYTWRTGEYGKINTELNGFYRLMENRIFVRPPSKQAYFSYYNIDGVLIKGLEAELRYSFKNRFSIGTNATFQDVRNNVKYMIHSTVPNFVYRDRMYNTPYFFANADAAYTIDNIGKRNLKMVAFYSTGYVSEFYLNYPSIAQSGNKSTIPTQFTQDVGITLSAKESRYNLTVECRNFTDALAYDDIAMQKPGRALYAKFRYFLTK